MGEIIKPVLNKTIILVMLFFCSVYAQVESADVVILGNSLNNSISDNNSREVAEFYGIRVKNVQMKEVLPEDELKNPDGSWIESLVLNTRTLYQMSQESVLRLRSLMDSCGINILLNSTYELADAKKLANLNLLSSNSIRKVEQISYYKEISVGAVPGYPELSGLKITLQGGGGVFSIGTDESGIPILKVNSDDSGSICWLARRGKGYLLINGLVQNLEFSKYKLDVIQNNFNFPRFFPIALFMKLTNGEKCWHSNHIYANFTIDDPNFVNPYGELDYFKLLDEMNRHDFHTTIAYIPRLYNSPQDRAVIELFKKYPERYSIVQHGNNHDGYEFICYTKEQLDSLNRSHGNAWLNEKYRPVAEHEKNVVEGKTKLKELESITGIKAGNVMVFPQGISMTPTFEILKKYNFLASFNGQYVPYYLLPGDSSREFHENFGEFITDFGNFPIGNRISADLLSNESMSKVLMRVFLDMPLLFYSHADYFRNGIDRFSYIADFLKSMDRKVEWKSLDDIASRLCYEKSEDDGTLTVKFFQNKLYYTNETKNAEIIHFRKDEVQNVPIVSLTVDGSSYPYRIENGVMSFDIFIPVGTSRTIQVEYSSGDKDFSINDMDVYQLSELAKLHVNVHNKGKDGGPCPVKFSVVDKKEVYSQIKVTDWIYPDSTVAVEFELPRHISNDSEVQVLLDPYDIIYEDDKSNNKVNIGISSLNDKNPESISDYELLQNFPNPFNAETKIRYTLKNDTHVRISVFNSLGEEIKCLTNRMESRGRHEILFNANDMPSGIYFYRFKTSEKLINRKMILVK